MRLKFSGNFAASSDVVLNSIEDQKKGLHHNLALYSAKIWDLLVLTATFLPNHPDAYS